MSPETMSNSALKITPDQKLSLIKQEFNKQFPYLKLEFFRHRHKMHGGSTKQDILESDATPAQLHRKAASQFIEVTGEMKVATLEEQFYTVFGISAQVFRKSGRSWLETTITDDWTLNRQNDEGCELSTFTKS